MKGCRACQYLCPWLRTDYMVQGGGRNQWYLLSQLYQSCFKTRGREHWYLSHYDNWYVTLRRILLLAGYEWKGNCVFGMKSVTPTRVSLVHSFSSFSFSIFQKSYLIDFCIAISRHLWFIPQNTHSPADLLISSWDRKIWQNDTRTIHMSRKVLIFFSNYFCLSEWPGIIYLFCICLYSFMSLSLAPVRWDYSFHIQQL